MGQETTTPTAPDTLRAVFEARDAAGLPRVVEFKYEDEASGPAWLEPPGGEPVPLATTSWDADETGPSGSSMAWFPLSYVRRWARAVGATVEER